MSLPLTPTIEPQLAKPATALPPEGEWLYEPKWDGFRVIAFVDGDEVFLQSRNGKPLDRYFPELTLPPGRYVLDGEIVIDPGDGSQDFGALQQRIHPAASRVEMLARETPATIVAFDLLAEGDEVLLERPFSERRAALERLLADVGEHSVSLTPQEPTMERAERWLDTAEGVIAKQADAPYVPGKRLGMFKVRRRRTLDCVICGYRPGTDPDSVGSLILCLYDDKGEMHVVGHCSAFSKKEKRELLVRLRPLETGKHGSGEASRWTAGRELEWVELRPELVIEVSYDHDERRPHPPRHAPRALARRPRPEELQPRPARLGLSFRRGRPGPLSTQVGPAGTPIQEGWWTSPICCARSTSRRASVTCSSRSARCARSPASRRCSSISGPSVRPSRRSASSSGSTTSTRSSM